MPPVLAFDRVTKSYPLGDRSTRDVLRDVSFSVPENGIVALVGRSGSGKTTLLNIGSGIDVPTSGSVRLAGRDLGSLGEHERTLLRRDAVGIVFQFFHLLPHLGVADNVALPEWIAGSADSTTDTRVEHLLERVGLADRRDDPVQKLSGGEMQRIAICRALLRRPKLILADEPTGNLDDENARAVMELLLELCRSEGSALLYVTHSPDMAAMADAVWRIHSGQLETT